MQEGAGDEIGSSQVSRSERTTKGANIMSKNEAIRFELSEEQEATIKAASNDVQLSDEDLGQKREGEFIAWNCPFVECKAALQ